MKTLITLKRHAKLPLIAASFMMAQFSVNAQNSTPQSPSESLQASLYHLNSDGSTALADGNYTAYDDVYLNGVSDDAVKMINFGENFGIIRDGIKLAIEQRKKINIQDTTFFCMWNMQQRMYRLKLVAGNLNHPGLIGNLMDNYTHNNTSLELNGTTTVDFEVDANPDSRAQDRFTVVFRNPTLNPPPTAFAGFTAILVGSTASLQWSVQNENNMNEYQVEHSVNGTTFNTVKSVQAVNSGGAKTYNAVDAGLARGDNYYRIKSVTSTGAAQYTDAIKLTYGSPAQEISVYPNPVVDKKMNMIFPGPVTGKYYMVLYSSNGTAIPLPSVQVQSAQSIQAVYLPKATAPGIYRLRIIGPDNAITIKTINVL